MADQRAVSCERNQIGLDDRALVDCDEADALLLDLEAGVFGRDD
jgi:hypothetical protein